MSLFSFSFSGNTKKFSGDMWWTTSNGKRQKLLYLLWRNSQAIWGMAINKNSFFLLWGHGYSLMYSDYFKIFQNWTNPQVKQKVNCFLHIRCSSWNLNEYQWLRQWYLRCTGTSNNLSSFKAHNERRFRVLLAGNY